MSKTQLPSLDGDLDVRKRVDLKAIRAASGTDDAAIEENSRRIGAEWGAVTSLPRPQKTQLASLRIEVPEYLDRELAVKAAEMRVTKQFLVLQALQHDGYRIEAHDLVEDKRKARR